MPEFAPAPICGPSWQTNRPTSRKWRRLPAIAVQLMILQVLSFCVLAGCDSEPQKDPNIAIRHAEVRAIYHAEIAILTTHEAILLHPQSDRQRHAREQRLYFDEIKDRIPERWKPEFDDGYSDFDAHIEPLETLYESTADHALENR